MSINFHIPDFTRNFHLNMMLIKLLQAYPQYFRDDIRIASVFGEFPISAWNGGRCHYGKIDKDSMKKIIHTINAENIPIRFTFTNPVLEKKHLSDAHCNLCMNLANNGLNEVIVVSELLEGYIRRNYPNYKITSSTCKQIEGMDALKAELEKDYHLVVLDYNWNNRFDELEKIPHKEKCELLLNACCPPACKRRREHYQYLGRRQLEAVDFYKNHTITTPLPTTGEPFVCENITKHIYQITDYTTHITPDDLYEKYVPMGFSHFKIEGRSSNFFNVMETYMYYMAKPEYRDELRLIFLLSLQHNHALEVLN